MKLTADDIPCLVKSKYIQLPKKRVLSLTKPEDVDECFDESNSCYEEILIGGGNISSKIEFNIARCKCMVNMEFTNMPDGDFYFQKYKSHDGNTMYRLVKIYAVISRIPRAPNCITTLMKYSAYELKTDLNRLYLCLLENHKNLVLAVMAWYAEFSYDRIKLGSNDGKYGDGDGDEIAIYPNLIAEIQGWD